MDFHYLYKADVMYIEIVLGAALAYISNPFKEIRFHASSFYTRGQAFLTKLHDVYQKVPVPSHQLSGAPRFADITN